MSTFLPTVAVQLEAESAAGVSELLQPGQGQRHAPALVVSVLHGHQPRHRQVGVISPHLPQSAGHLATCTSVLTLFSRSAKDKVPSSRLVMVLGCTPANCATPPWTHHCAL